MDTTVGQTLSHKKRLDDSILNLRFTTLATSLWCRPQGRCWTDLPLLPLSHSTWAAKTLKVAFCWSPMWIRPYIYADHLVNQTIRRIWRVDIQSSAPHNMAARWSLICTKRGPKVLHGATILLLLGPFYGLWRLILDPKEITEGLSSLTGWRPSPTMDEGGQVHCKED